MFQLDVEEPSADLLVQVKAQGVQVFTEGAMRLVGMAAPELILKLDPSGDPAFAAAVPPDGASWFRGGGAGAAWAWSAPLGVDRMKRFD